MNSRKLTLALSVLILAGTAALVAPARGDAKKPKYTVSEVMKAIHKGEDNIGKRAVKGQASKEDIAKLAEYYASLPLSDPPRGAKDSWMTKTAALVKAADALKAGAPGAPDTFKAAANCKACHEAHKPEDKK